METSPIYAHVRERITSVPRRDIIFSLCTGVAVAFLALPILQNLDLFYVLARFGISEILALIVLLFLAPVGLLTLAVILRVLPIQHKSAEELSRYAVVGVFNVFLNAAIFNSLIFVSGISSGIRVTGFALITFVIVITQSFFWNVFWTFRHIPAQNRKRQYLRFLLVTATTALVNLGIIQIFVNVIGAPAGISAALWANIALLFTIITAVIGNFFGYKFFVFRDH